MNKRKKEKKKVAACPSLECMRSRRTPSQKTNNKIGLLKPAENTHGKIDRILEALRNIELQGYGAGSVAGADQVVRGGLVTLPPPRWKGGFRFCRPSRYA